MRELVESSDAQLEGLRQSLREADEKASGADSALQAARSELERVRPFEKEVKEKNLLIGKLRHEAVTLNDHLTKALRFLRKGKPEDNVDRYVTAWTLSFLTSRSTSCLYTNVAKIVQTHCHKSFTSFPCSRQIRSKEVPNLTANCCASGLDRW